MSRNLRARSALLAAAAGLSICILLADTTPARGQEDPRVHEFVTTDPTHGGMVYTTQGLVHFRVFTVGYDHEDANEHFDFDTIQEAIDASAGARLLRDGSTDPFMAGTPDLIRVNGGEYAEHLATGGAWFVVAADGDITLRGASATDTEVLQASTPLAVDSTGARRRLSIGGSHIAYSSSGDIDFAPWVNAQGVPASNQRGITCTATLIGGVSEPVKIDLTGVTFTGFRSGGPGGAVRDFMGRATSCTFDDCRSTGDGGAISGRSTAGGDRDVIDCDFTDCQASGSGADGGALFGMDEIGISTGASSAGSCTFTDCTADGNGGAVSGATVVARSTISGCSADGVGGGLHAITSRIGLATSIVGGVTTTGSVEISGCTAAEGGAAAECDATIVGCAFDGNEATVGGGGGVSGIGGDIERCRFTSNVASGTGGTNGRGGAIRLSSGKILNCMILANEASGHGGGIFNSDGAIKHCTILKNISGDLGGGLKACDGNIRNCIIVENTDANGGTNSDQVNDCAAIQFCRLPTGWSGNGSNLVKGATSVIAFTSFTGTDPIAWVLTIGSTSDCRNAGTDQSTITGDFFGFSRPVGGAWDIGAHERQ